MITQQQLTDYRELVKFGSAIGVGGNVLESLLDEIDRLKRELEDAKTLHVLVPCDEHRWMPRAAQVTGWCAPKIKTVCPHCPPETS